LRRAADNDQFSATLVLGYGTVIGKAHVRINALMLQ
jgi:hypothetical protein